MFDDSYASSGLYLPLDAAAGAIAADTAQQTFGIGISIKVHELRACAGYVTACWFILKEKIPSIRIECDVRGIWTDFHATPAKRRIIHLRQNTLAVKRRKSLFSILNLRLRRDEWAAVKQLNAIKTQWNAQSNVKHVTANARFGGAARVVTKALVINSNIFFCCCHGTKPTTARRRRGIIVYAMDAVPSHRHVGRRRCRCAQT